MMVPATIVKDPSQSTACNPLRNGVFGVCMSRKMIRMMKARPSNGRLIQTDSVSVDDADDSQAYQTHNTISS